MKIKLSMILVSLLFFVLTTCGMLSFMYTEFGVESFQQFHLLFKSVMRWFVVLLVGGIAIVAFIMMIVSIKSKSSDYNNPTP